MQMKRRRSSLQLLDQAQVKTPFQARSQARLNADLGRTQCLRLQGSPDDFLDLQEVSLFASLGPGEGAESAGFDADVGEVDVAVDDVGDFLPGLSASQLVGSGQQRVQVAAVHRAQPERAAL